MSERFMKGFIVASITVAVVMGLMTLVVTGNALGAFIVFCSCILFVVVGGRVVFMLMGGKPGSR